MRISAILTCLAALTCLPSLALGAEGLRDGIYDAYDCAVPVSDQRVTLRGDDLTFYESACRLSNPVHVLGMAGAVLFDAACSGEGETWAARYLLMPAHDGGLIVVGEHWAERHARCE